MKKATKATGEKEEKKKAVPLAKHQRKNSNASTRNEGRQRSGNNDPQQGSH